MTTDVKKLHIWIIKDKKVFDSANLVPFATSCSAMVTFTKNVKPVIITNLE